MVGLEDKYPAGLQNGNLVQIGHDGETEEDPARTLTVRLRSQEVVVHITHHTKLRMDQRRISEVEMLAVLEFPSDRKLPTQEGRKRYDRHDPYRKRRLDVVFVENTDGSITIISTMWSP